MTVSKNGAKTLTARMTMTDPVFYPEPVVAENPRVDGADGGYVHSVVTKDGVTRFGLR